MTPTTCRLRMRKVEEAHDPTAISYGPLYGELAVAISCRVLLLGYISPPPSPMKQKA